MVEGTHNTSKCVETEQLRMFMSQSLGLGYDRLMNSTAEDAQLVSKYFRFDAFLGRCVRVMSPPSPTSPTPYASHSAPLQPNPTVDRKRCSRLRVPARAAL